MSKIGVLGAGTWGMALAKILANNNHQVTVWSALPEEIDELSTTRRHKNLQGMVIPDSMFFTKDIKEVCENKDVLLFAVPSAFVRSTTRRAAPYITPGQVIVDVAKGVEADTLYTMSQVIYEELQSVENVRVVAFSGPTHAEEVALDMPTSIVSGCEDIGVAEFIQDLFSGTCLRVYTNPDVLGIELCGAMKNIIALASGITKGLGYGDNTRAALITRGMVEIHRLGKKMGCLPETFYGLAGMGDLIVTATSIHSRNNKCGMLIGQGVKPQDAIKQVGMVVEGVSALPAAMNLMERYRVDLPIIKSVNDIVNLGMSPSATIEALMYKGKKTEVSRVIYDSCFRDETFVKNEKMKLKRVLTYGTFDLLHYGHINLLSRAKALGDYLVVGVSTDEFNLNEKHKKSYSSYEERKELVESVEYVDRVIPESSWEQKLEDIEKYNIDTFVIGDNWKGKFDYLKEKGVEVVYLPRTPNISTTKIKKDLMLDEYLK